MSDIERNRGELQEARSALARVIAERDEAKANAMDWFRNEEMQGERADAAESRLDSLLAEIAALEQEMRRWAMNNRALADANVTSAPEFARTASSVASCYEHAADRLAVLRGQE